MTQFFIGLIVGAVVGSVVTVLALAPCRAASDS